MLAKIAIIVIAIALVWGLEQVMISPLETGEVYPEYSTLRSDPMGAMALYESLAKVLPVERLYNSRTFDPDTTVFILGVDPRIKKEDFNELTSKGGRIVIGFLRTDMNIQVLGRHLGLDNGNIVLIDDSYPLSNEGLREKHDAALIAQLVGPAKRVVFDENHLGVVEAGSIAKLMRKYHLEGALGVLALVAALFLWRSASSLLPSRAPRPEQAVTGRDSLEGMVALLRRGIAEKDLVRVCYEEWKRTSLNDLKSSKIDAVEPLIDHKNAVIAYKALMEKL